MALDVLGMGLECRSCDEQLKKERGCTADGMVPFEVDGERLFRCPRSLITPISWEYIDAYSLYKVHFLPNGNAWLDESRKFIDAMIVLSNKIAQMENKAIEKQ